MIAHPSVCPTPHQKGGGGGFTLCKDSDECEKTNYKLSL